VAGLARAAAAAGGAKGRREDMKRTAVFLTILLGIAAGCGPKTGYASPEEAMAALTKAAETGDPKAITAVFGPGSEEISESGDPVADRKGREMFLSDVKEALAFEKSPAGATIAVIGAEKWPFPVPLVEKDGRWSFDPAGAKEEILSRRIGGNELHTIASCHAYADAQEEYRSKSRDGKKPQYAQRFLSTPGKHDGLFWDMTEGGERSPMGILVADASIEGYQPTDTPVQYHGYFFKALHSQGPNAPGGAKDYVKNGVVDGYALVAWPADYGNSGIMTFQINQVGIVFQKDLGEKTDETVRAMTAYDPDDTWQPTSD